MSKNGVPRFLPVFFMLFLFAISIISGRCVDTASAAGGHSFYSLMPAALGAYSVKAVSTITQPVDGAALPASLGAYSIKGTATDDTGSGIRKVDVSFDGGASWRPAADTSGSGSFGTWAYNWSPLPLGTHSISSRATANNNSLETPAPGTHVTVDGLAPTGSIAINGGAQFTNSLTVALTLSAEDFLDGSVCPEFYPHMCNVASMQFSNGGAPWTEWEPAATSKQWTLTPGDGTKAVRVRYKDAAGNVSNIYIAAITLDTAPPASFITPLPPALPGISYIITGTAEDGTGSGVKNVEVSTDGGATWNTATGTTTWSYIWTLPADGIYTIRVRSTDNLDNVETPGLGITVTVDKTPPASSIIAPPAGSATNAASFEITGTAADAGTGVKKVEVTFDGGNTWNQASDASGNNSFSTWMYNWAPLPLGSHSISARATDNADNAETPAPGLHFTVDRTPPTAVITGPSSGMIIGSGATFAITGTAADEGGAGVQRVEVSADGGATWAPATGTASWSYSWVLPPDGSFVLKARAVDMAGNTGPPGPDVPVMVDRTPPSSAVIAPSPGAYLGGGLTYTVAGTSGDGAGSGVSLVEVSADGGTTWGTATGTGTWSYSWTLPADGAYTVMTRSTDLAGHTETPVPGVSVTVDRTPPTSVITSPAAGAFIGGTLFTITGTANDAGSGVSGVEVSTDGGATWSAAAGTAAWTYTWTLPANGSFIIKSKAFDVATNAETPGAGIEVTVDRTPPNSVITRPAAGAFVGGQTCTIEGTADDAGGSGVQMVEVSTDGGATWNAAAGTAAWSYSWTLPANGSYNIKSRATDAAGNAEVPGAGVTVTVDITPPSSAITNPAAGAVLGGAAAVTVSGTASDTGGSTLDKVEVSTDGGSTWIAATGTASWTYSWTLPVDGSYTLKSRGYDMAGNIETPGGGVIVTVDSTPPVGSINTAKRYTKARTITLILSARDPGHDCPEPDPVMCNVTQMQLSGDGTAWDPWEAAVISKQWQFPKGEGAHTVFVKYKDPAGNVSAAYSVTVTVDTIAPSSTITSPADGTKVGGGSVFTITGTSNDGLGSGVQLVEVSTDGGNNWSTAVDTNGGTWATWSYAWTLPADGAGATIKSRATDNAGNAETPSAGVTVMVDKTPPTGSVIIDSGAEYTGTAAVTLTLTATDALSAVNGMQLSNDGVFDTEPWEAFAASKAWTLASGDGTKTVYVRFRDAANNVSGLYSDIISTDSAAPEGALSINGGAQYTSTLSITLTLNASDAGSGVSQMQISNDGVFDTEPWEAYAETKAWTLVSGDGPNTVHVRYKDSAGYISAVYSDTITVDLAVPAVSVTSPTQGLTLSGVLYSVTGTASDTGTGLSLVEVSTDGGTTWNPASGTASWTYDWVLPVKGSFIVKSRAADSAGNTAVSAGTTVTVNAYGSPELQHYNWDASFSITGCGLCHTPAGNFVPASFRKDGVGFCFTCHNPAGTAHETGIYAGHKVLVNVTSGGARMPTYGNITAAEGNNLPSSRLKDGNKLTCETCHNPMKKAEDYGRVWEMTTTGDRTTYMLQRGGWSIYGRLAPRVYRDTSLWSGQGPTYSKKKQGYLVDPSEYIYDEDAGTVTFETQQAATVYIYVSLDYPYLRASSQDNRLCADCHTQVTHQGGNCLTCHTAHNTGNKAGMREKVRTPDHTEQAVKLSGYTGLNSFADGDSSRDGICEVCHTQTKYYRRDGGGFANHSGGANYDRKDCTACHGHDRGFGK